MPRSRSPGWSQNCGCWLALSDALHLIADLIAFQLEAEERHAARGQALHDAEEAILFRDRFVAILGHDLRNPLSAVVTGSAILLRCDDLPSQHGTIARRIARSAARMDEIIASVLDAVRGNFGSLTIHEMPCDATGLVREVVDEILLSHDGRSIEIDAPAELRVAWDRGAWGRSCPTSWPRAAALRAGRRHPAADPRA